MEPHHPAAHHIPCVVEARPGRPHFPDLPGTLPPPDIPQALKLHKCGNEKEGCVHLGVSLTGERNVLSKNAPIARICLQWSCSPYEQGERKQWGK